MFIGVGVVDGADVVEMVAYVPVVGGAPDVFGGGGVVVGGLDALVDEAAVVVPDHEFDASQAGFGEGGAEEVFDEVALFGGGEDGGFEVLGGEGFVLDGEAPDGDVLGLAGLDVFDVVIGPGLVVLGLEFAAIDHGGVGFHPCGGAPGGGEEGEPPLGGGDGALDEGEAVFFVVLDGEVLEVFVAGGVVVGVDLAGEVAAGDGGAAQCVAIAEVGIEAVA